MLLKYFKMTIKSNFLIASILSPHKLKHSVHGHQINLSSESFFLYIYIAFFLQVNYFNL